MSATDQPTPHEFTEDVDDYSTCVCGTPHDVHHLIDQPTPEEREAVDEAWCMDAACTRDAHDHSRRDGYYGD